MISQRTSGRSSVAVALATVVIACQWFANVAFASAQGGSVPPGLVTSGPSGQAAVALVFVGDPGNNTAGFIRLIHRLYVPATFFVAGKDAAENAADIRALRRAGAQIGTATYGYVDLQSLSTPEVVSQISAGETALKHVLGVRPHWFQPPYGDVDSRVTGIASSLGLHTVAWSVNSGDTTIPDVAGIVEATVSAVKPGSIILFHSGMSAAAKTESAVEKVVTTLKRRGYRFGNLDQLFGLAPLPPCVPGARELFEARGIHTFESSIYQAWLNRLCRLHSLGPATSNPRIAGDGSVSQTFVMGRRLTYNPSTGSVKVSLAWSSGSTIFSANKVKPRFGDPITRAWFTRYFAGTDPGSALAKEQRFDQVTVQHFQDGWAVETSIGKVTWTVSFNPGSFPHP